MKKIITILSMFILSISIYAQTPNKFTYQAIVRNNDGSLETNKEVGIKITILQSSTTGTVAYGETQTTKTNANGLLTIKIGEGTPTSTNPTNTTIGSIDWKIDTYFIKMEIDLQKDGSYDIEGVSQLLSVPYALHAKTVKLAATGAGITDVNGLKVKTGQGITVDSNGAIAANPTIYTVGNYPELGGYVFEVFDGGKHGWVIANQNQADNKTFVESNNACNVSSNHDSNGAKFRDWSLPTLTQLIKIHINKIISNTEDTVYYWTDTIKSFDKGDRTDSRAGLRMSMVNFKSLVPSYNYSWYLNNNDGRIINARCVRSF